MPLVRVVQGQNVEAVAVFRDQNGGTIVGTGSPAQWTIRDPDNAAIANGTGSQGVSDPSHWTARFTMPATAPVTTAGQRYQIYWELPLTTGSISAIERFEVVSNQDPIGQDETSDILVIEGKPLVDTLSLPVEVVTDSLKYELRTIGNTLLVEESSTGSAADRVIGGIHYYDFNSGSAIEKLTVAKSDGLTPYMGIWEYQLPNEPKSYEFHGVYVANLQAIALIQKMKAIVDRANLKDIHPFLTFSDLDLLQYLYRGFEFVNSYPPYASSWSPANIPATMVDLVVKAGAFHALQGQYLAEGMSTFDFQGLGVQLSIDRTQYIQTIVDQLQSELQDRVPRTKRMIIRSSSAGVLHISVTPLTTPVLNIDVSFFGRGQLYRALPFVVLGF